MRLAQSELAARGRQSIERRLEEGLLERPPRLHGIARASGDATIRIGAAAQESFIQAPTSAYPGNQRWPQLPGGRFMPIAGRLNLATAGSMDCISIWIFTGSSMFTYAGSVARKECYACLAENQLCCDRDYRGRPQ